MSTIRFFLAVAAIAGAMAPGASAHETHHETQTPARDYAHAEETAFGRAADPATATRVVKVRMDDTMRYAPDRVVVKRAEMVRFVVTNGGKLMHELVLGTREELQRHAEMMRKHPGMEHDEAHMLHVPAGKTGEMGWRFTRAGEFLYGCLVPGHFEAGMVGKVTVVDK